MIITSTQNPLIKDIAALREPKDRRDKGMTLIDGLRETLRAYQAGVLIQKIFYCPKLLDDSQAFMAALRNNIEFIEVSDKVFEKIAYGQRVDGVIALAKTPKRSLRELTLSANPLVVVLESVEKPGNLGAILRTCDGAGVDALLICDPRTDAYNPNVIRASVATVFTVPTIVASKEDVAVFLKKHQMKIMGAFPDAKDVYSKLNLKSSLAIILGTEDQGLSEFWQKQCELKARIPMKGLADSLNVSVSAAVIIYEALRQRS